MTRRLSILVVSVVVASGCTADTPASTTTSTGVSSTVSSVVPDSTVVAPEVVQPPPLLVVASAERRVAVPGFDYCWDDPESEQALCADSCGTETPTDVEIHKPDVTVQWIDDAILTAEVRTDTGRCPLPVVTAGEGEWTVPMPELPGTYRIDLYGESPQGSTRFAIDVETSVEGPLSVPVATVWWPDTTNEFEPSAWAVGPRAGFEARLLVASADGVSNEFPMAAVYHFEEGAPIECGSLFWMVHGDGPITFAYNEEALGRAPYEITLTVGVKGPEFERTWTWPDDLGSEDTLTGPMHPTSGEPWHPDGDSDPLIDTDG